MKRPVIVYSLEDLVAVSFIVLTKYRKALVTAKELERYNRAIKNYLYDDGFEDIEFVDKNFKSNFYTIIDNKSGFTYFLNPGVRMGDLLNHYYDDMSLPFLKAAFSKDSIRILRTTGRINAYTKTYHPSYKKLVRDNTPEVMIKNGEEPITRSLEDVEYKEELHRKLKEEYIETVEAISHKEIIDEVADLLEVAFAIGKTAGFKEEEILKRRDEKRSELGGFDKRIYLEGVVEVKKKKKKKEENNENTYR